MTGRAGRGQEPVARAIRAAPSDRRINGTIWAQSESFCGALRDRKNVARALLRHAATPTKVASHGGCPQKLDRTATITLGWDYIYISVIK